MKHVTSRDNALFKHLKALVGSTHQRRKAGQSVLDGVHLAQAYVAAIGQPVSCVVGERHYDHAEVRPVLDQVEPERVVVLADALFSQISNVANGIDLLFVIDTPAGHLPAQIATDCVILDGVQDAGNVGSILRSAAAAGIPHAFLMTGCAFAWSVKTLRAGMGANFHLNIVEHCTLEMLASRLAVPLLATSSHADATVFDTDLRQPVGWVVGNEGAGVSEEWMARVSRKVGIPQPGGLESLNVAAATAICLFEAVRQRRTA
ncbi:MULTISPECIES: RNA methyltransferase [unclassified Cupriavidus]|uniref:TrmH family RNA methyltransferase n=1 Tax=unclassified Cupriavidus TaxID=2640874 RepID=UPI001C005EDD|nr:MULTISPECIES: RNA methyltransferase [unclassified Cupriavidus]MCA3189684.1 RNA methyltransferase [Cupriavidus sp.]MCA3195678.1 RNA methyltransferase [Cupriavidus sp.]MCA3203835.1 RNA methyltransferase [Cupriavidus sp.]MCA3209432.1 RNA methyltransferase [Cupriavidus sp.]MCA3233481.1 RNA methyltransferase [Cupriavidus sp.]